MAALESFVKLKLLIRINLQVPNSKSIADCEHVLFVLIYTFANVEYIPWYPNDTNQPWSRNLQQIV